MAKIIQMYPTPKNKKSADTYAQLVSTNVHLE